jgi:hypothetical protein
MRIFKKHDFLNYLFFGVVAFFALLSSAVSIVLFYVSDKDVGFPYAQLFFFVTFTGFYFIYYFILPKQMYKASPLFGGTENYVFTDGEIINETVGKKVSARAVYKYDAVCKVYEKPSVLYVYVAPNLVLIVSKYGFETPEGLDTVREKLRACVPASKYKIIK